MITARTAQEIDSGGFQHLPQGKVAMDADCCCGACPVCAGTAPPSLDVTLAGITNDNCEDCTTFNDTFTLDWYAGSATQCEWRYYFPSGVCDINTYIVARLTYVGGTYGLTVQLSWYNGGADYLRWCKDFGASQPTCSPSTCSGTAR